MGVTADHSMGIGNFEGKRLGLGLYPNLAMDGDAIVSQQKQLEFGPMPNVMVALPDIGGALCSTPQSLAGAHY